MPRWPRRFAGRSSFHMRALTGSIPLLLVGFLLLLLSCDPPVASAAEPSEPHILQFTPQGTVKGVRQVSARFSEPMVPLGDPRVSPELFEIDCPESGTGRWIDSRTWVYDFARDLPGGIRCTFRLRPGLTSLTGKAVAGQQMFAFSTGGPAIRFSWPGAEYSRIDEEQAFVLFLDAEATEESILAHVSFSITGVVERVGVRVLAGEVRDAILQVWKAGSHTSPGPVVVLQARQRFPNSSQVDLVWGKGVTSSSGVATEQDQTLTFRTRDAFTAKFHCERVNPQAGCLPITPMQLHFSALVAREQARQAVLIGPQAQRWEADMRGVGEGDVSGVTFKAPFPEAAVFQLEVPAGLTDDAGRPLSNAASFPLTVKTDAFPPLAKFSARFGIVEWKADPALPVTLRHLEPEIQTRLLQLGDAGRTEPTGQQGPPAPVSGRMWQVPPEHIGEIQAWLRKVAVARRDVSIFGSQEADPRIKMFALPKPHGESAFEVVGIPLEAPGFYVVELESASLGASLLDKPQPMYVPAAALVTNLSVHFKWGRETSLVWVTTLDAGRPVPDAQVAVHNCRGIVLWRGQTDRQGIARLGRLPSQDTLPSCPFDYPERFYSYDWTPALRNLSEGLFVTAQVQNDLSFVHSSWGQGIEGWRFQLSSGRYRGHVVAHTIFDRPLFRAGETVHMKHLLRDQVLRGFALVPEAQRPTHAVIQHLGSDETYELSLHWDAAGSAENTWRIPKEAKLGLYLVLLQRPSPRGGALDSFEPHIFSGQFRVEEFRVPLLRGSLRLPPEPQTAVSEVPVDMSVQYLAGGGAGNLPVTLRAQLRPTQVPGFEKFEGFTFANGPLQKRISRREDESEGEAANEAEVVSPARVSPAGTREIHQRQELNLDAAGTARAAITRFPQLRVPRDLLVELEFRDPNGEVQTISNSVLLWPASWLVGLKPDAWVASREQVKANVAVVDLSGRPVAGAPVQVELLERKTYSHRKRLVGGFYAYEHTEEIRRVGEFCQGVTDAQGFLLCEGKPPVEGNLVLQATVTDPSGHRTTAHREVWVAGSRAAWFRVQDNDRMDLLPEKRRYEPGETAQVQVRMPFREATALVAIEREGVLEASVVSLSGNDPVITVPVKENYAPNIFISVLAVRGRVSGVQPTALVDLGRPSFKLGVTEIQVGWQAHELRVRVAADRAVYRVRENAAVKISVQTAAGRGSPPGSEVAVAAVDEGLLELLPNGSWNLLEAMMGRRGYEVETATAQMQVIGKRHYGLKAVAQGGGGGRQTTRELFDTLLFWKGRVPLDAQGEASVEIPLNDSLTSFRIVAIATGGVGHFGTGSTTIRSTQDLMLLSGVSPLIRDGDRFRSEFTVRNTTDHPMAVAVSGRVEGLGEPLASQALALSPGEARIVTWDITAPADAQVLRYDVEARSDDGATDRLRVTQQVHPAVPVRTFQATLFRGEPAMTQAIERPADALADRGGVRVALSPTLIEGLEGVREWMRHYPYTCLEQQVSRAVALRDQQLWVHLMGVLPAYLDSAGLLKYFPTMGWGSEVLTSYVLAIGHEAGWTVPDETREKMLTGLQKFVEGTTLRHGTLAAADLSLRKLAALEALSRYGKAEPRLLGSILIEPNFWPTSAVLDWWGLLHRVAGMRNREARMAEAEQIIRSRLNLQGTTMRFSTERDDALWWLMVSSDGNAIRLILQLLETGLWQEDLPRLMRGMLARQRRGAWDLTLANAWGTLAVEKFSRTFEATPVTGTTSASLAGATHTLEWSQTPQGSQLALPWPAQREDLTLAHAGTGHPWITVQAQAAIPLTVPFFSGYQLSKTLTPVERREPDRWSRGDLVRVQLTIQAQSDMTWVVVNDPIPAGASHLGAGLARHSQMATQGETRKGTAWPAFVERAFEGFRGYYEYVPKGTFVVEYTIRLNQSGRFQLPPTRVEALYAPEMFGELPNAPLEVQP